MEKPWVINIYQDKDTQNRTNLEQDKLMEAAAATSSDGEGADTPALSRRGVVTMSTVSLLFAVLAARALCRSDGAAAGTGDEEDAFFSVVRRLSPLICAYLVLWTIVLSEPAERLPAAVAGRFVRASYPPLLAHAARKLLGPVVGTAAMCAATSFAAAAAGRSLAERRLLTGADQSAAAAAASTEHYRSRAEEADAASLRGLGIFLMVFASAMLSGINLLAFGEVKLDTVLRFAAPYLLVTRLGFLRGGPLEGITCEAVVVTFIGLFVGWFVLVLPFLAFGEAAMEVVSWAGTMAMAGYLGYGLAVHWSYQQLMIVKRSQPPAVQDASGLPVGRDEEDACAAHIEATSCVSRWRTTREYFYQEETGASLPDDIAQFDYEVERLSVANLLPLPKNTRHPSL